MTFKNKVTAGIALLISLASSAYAAQVILNPEVGENANTERQQATLQNSMFTELYNGGAALVCTNGQIKKKISGTWQCAEESGGTETDPVYSGDPASGITSTLVGHWNTAYGWGDHDGLYEDALGNPSVTDYCLKSATDGTRSWGACGTGGGDISDLEALSGVASGSTNLGTFTGSTISDNRNNKQAMQDLETAIEGIGGSSIITDLTGTANRVLWVDSSGDVSEIALGNSGTVLTSNGTTSAPGFSSVSGTGDMQTSTYDAAGVSEQLVGLTATQTLTNKRLTGPGINDATPITSTSTEINLLDGLTVLSGSNTGDEIAATDAIAGVLEIATSAETITGTDGERAVTPAGLTAKLADGITVGSITTTSADGTHFINYSNTTACPTTGQNVGDKCHLTTPNPDEYYTYSGSAWVQDTTSAGSVEGTAVLSTGETGGVKYLREDGDGTSSWQTIAGSSSGVTVVTSNPVAGDLADGEVAYNSTNSTMFIGLPDSAIAGPSPAWGYIPGTYTLTITPPAEADGYVTCDDSDIIGADIDCDAGATRNVCSAEVPAGAAITNLEYHDASGGGGALLVGDDTEYSDDVITVAGGIAVGYNDNGGIAAVLSGNIAKGYISVNSWWDCTTGEYVKMLVYNAVTKALVAESAAVECTTQTAPGFIEFTFMSGSIASGTSYILAGIADDYIRYNSSSATSDVTQDSTGTVASPPDPIGTNVYSGYGLTGGMYVTN